VLCEIYIEALLVDEDLADQVLGLWHEGVIPQLPHLIRQFLINQQGFDVEFGMHGLILDC
jgi:hypothetical protein